MHTRREKIGIPAQAPGGRGPYTTYKTQTPYPIPWNFSSAPASREQILVLCRAQLQHHRNPCRARRRSYAVQGKRFAFDQIRYNRRCSRAIVFLKDIQNSQTRRARQGDPVRDPWTNLAGANGAAPGRHRHGSHRTKRPEITLLRHESAWPEVLLQTIAVRPTPVTNSSQSATRRSDHRSRGPPPSTLWAGSSRSLCPLRQEWR